MTPLTPLSAFAFGASAGMIATTATLVLVLLNLERIDEAWRSFAEIFSAGYVKPFTAGWFKAVWFRMLVRAGRLAHSKRVENVGQLGQLLLYRATVGAKSQRLDAAIERLRAGQSA